MLQRRHSIKHIRNNRVAVHRVARDGERRARARSAPRGRRGALGTRCGHMLWRRLHLYHVRSDRDVQIEVFHGKWLDGRDEIRLLNDTMSEHPPEIGVKRDIP